MTNKARSNQRELLSAQRCAELLKALGDRDRLRIVAYLRQAPHAVSEIAGQLGVEIANASHHLGVLRRAGLVTTTRRGKQIIYELPAEVFPQRADNCQRVDLGCCRLEMAADD